MVLGSSPLPLPTYLQDLRNAVSSHLIPVPFSLLLARQVTHVKLKMVRNTDSIHTGYNTCTHALCACTDYASIFPRQYVYTLIVWVPPRSKHICELIRAYRVCSSTPWENNPYLYIILYMYMHAYTHLQTCNNSTTHSKFMH